MDIKAKKHILQGVFVGFILGALFTFPHVYKWMQWPLVYVDVVPLSVYYNMKEIRHTVKDVISKEVQEPTNVEVVISDVLSTRVSCLEIYEKELSQKKALDFCDSVMGFYFYDKTAKKHWIYSIDNTAVLTHEFRHIFEGHFHRAPNN